APGKWARRPARCRKARQFDRTAQVEIGAVAFHLSAAVQNLSIFIVLYNDTKSWLLRGESLYFIYG
ncbi:hypothetical protein DPF36_22360, partial [Salmonella enterica subsp. enterica serovar Mississippi]|nr:hypothetical protein [Salmonella enterica subsp. enterica serovar Mississippi]